MKQSTLILYTKRSTQISQQDLLCNMQILHWYMCCSSLKVKYGLIDYLLFYVSLKKFSLIWRHHHCRWRAAKFRPMLGAQGVWAWRNIYRTTPAVTRGLGCSGFIWRTASISHLLWYTRRCGGPILTQILTGLKYEQRKCKAQRKITQTRPP
jgi:hypothetical protein